MVRLVFRPYTQVRRTICTSVSLRASTRVSSGFALLRHSSPSFGSQQVCSYSNRSQKIRVGRRCGRCRPPSRQVPCASWGCAPPTRIHVRLLGPCFKTGELETFRQRLERAGLPKEPRSPKRTRALRGRRTPPSSIDASASDPDTGTGSTDASIHADQRLASVDRGAPAASKSFPLNNFKYCFTLFSKCFSSFPRGTCSLSVSRPYLALDGIYHPIGAAFPNNPTRRTRFVERGTPVPTGLSPSPTSRSRELRTGTAQKTRL